MKKLNGSEKQIKWANDIRNKLWNSFKRAIKQNYNTGIRKNIDIAIIRKATKDQLKVVFDALKKETESTFYIENRDLPWNKMLSKMIAK